MNTHMILWRNICMLLLSGATFTCNKVTGADSVGEGGKRGSVEPHFDSKFHFHGKFWINLINLEYRIYP